jgi:hypothetical protein
MVWLGEALASLRPKLPGAECGKIGSGDSEIELGAGGKAVCGSDLQGFVHNHFGSALDVALKLEPLTMAHARAETEKKSAASQRRVITEKLTSNRNSGATVGVAQLVEFVSRAQSESSLSWTSAGRIEAG